MLDAPISCPYCNARITGSPTAGKLICSRCGEAVPLPEGHSESSSNLEAELLRHRQSRQARAARSIKATLILGLSLGALGIIAGLCIAWFKPKDPSPRSTPKAEPVRPVAPAEMPAIAYLPEGTDSIIALQLRPLIDSLPNNQDKDPRSILKRYGLGPELISILEQTVPVGLDKIDQAVIGLKLKEGSLLHQVVLVMRTNEDCSIEAVAERTKANAFTKDGRLYYNSRSGSGLQYYWSPNNRILVAGFDTDSLKAIPEEGRPGLGHLSPRLAEIMRTQLGAETCFWAVLDSEKWANIGGAFSLISGKRFDLTEILSSLRTVVLALNLDPEPSIVAWFDAASEAKAAEWRKWLAGQLKDNGKVTVGGAGNRLLVRLPAQEEVIRSLVGKLTPKK